jgi:hypothetical protein
VRKHIPECKGGDEMALVFSRGVEASSGTDKEEER